VVCVCVYVWGVCVWCVCVCVCVCAIEEQASRVELWTLYCISTDKKSKWLHLWHCLCISLFCSRILKTWLLYSLLYSWIAVLIWISLRGFWLNVNIKEDTWLAVGMNFLRAAHLMFGGADIQCSAWEQATISRSNTERFKSEIRVFSNQYFDYWFIETTPPLPRTTCQRS